MLVESICFVFGHTWRPICFQKVQLFPKGLADVVHCTSTTADATVAKALPTTARVDDVAQLLLLL